VVTESMTFGQRIAAEVRAGRTPEEVAADLSVTATPDDVAELIEEKARIIGRAEVRERESDAFRERFRDIAAGAPITIAPSVTMRQLFNEKFSLGSGEVVTWGQATVAQHALRIEMLGKIRAGIDETIGRHREAIRMIEANGVSRLEEIA
jgi:hypothetical protein